MAQTGRLSRLIVLALLTLTLITGCGTTPSSAPPAADAPAAATPAPAAADDGGDEATPAPAAEQLDRVTLEFMAPSPVTQVNDFEEVLGKVYEQLDATLNIRINYVFTTFDDIGQKASLKMSSGEQLDSVFVAQWTNPSLAQMVSQGLLTNLDEQIATGKYPALAQRFAGEYRSNNAVKDANGEYHLYAFPHTRSYSGGSAIFYRADLAEKYGMGEITDYESLTAFFDAVLENEPGMTPFSFLGSNDSLHETLRTIYRSEPQLEKHNEVTVESVGMIIGDDGVAYGSKHVEPRLDPEYWSRVYEPLKAEDPLLAYRLARDWYVKGYIEKDILSQKDYEGQFMAGRAAAFPRAADTYLDIVARLQGALPSAKLGTFFYQPNVRFDTDKASGSDFRAWNFSAIPVTSQYVDRVMGFMEWLFSDKANHDLIEFGIEGKHWTAIGEDAYEIPADMDPGMNYNFYGYVLSWHPEFVRYDNATPENIISVFNRMSDVNFYFKMPESGFTIVTDSIKTEVAKINDLRALKRAVANGVIEDIEGELASIQEQYDQAGYQIVVDETVRQFNEFLAENPYQGQ